MERVKVLETKRFQLDLITNGEPEVLRRNLITPFTELGPSPIEAFCPLVFIGTL